MLTTHDIRAELIRRGYTAARLARELGVHRSTVTRVINGETRSPQILAAIASLIEVPVESLAPGSNLTQKQIDASMSADPICSDRRSAGGAA